jgi:hypothetical protein
MCQGVHFISMQCAPGLLKLQLVNNNSPSTIHVFFKLLVNDLLESSLSALASLANCFKRAVPLDTFQQQRSTTHRIVTTNSHHFAMMIKIK